MGKYSPHGALFRHSIAPQAVASVPLDTLRRWLVEYPPVRARVYAHVGDQHSGEAMGLFRGLPASNKRKQCRLRRP